MEQRPKLKPELTSADILLEIAGWLALAALWIIVLFYFKELPDNIPTHFNAAGKADDTGSKGTFFILPSLTTFTFLLMTVLNRFPHVFNYPVSITAATAMRQYTLATRLIRVMKLSINIIFLLVSISIVNSALNDEAGTGIWFLPLILAFTIIPLIFYIIKSRKEK